MSPMLEIKLCTKNDIALLTSWDEVGYFEEAFEEQEDGKRLILLAFIDGTLTGYVHLNRFPKYAPFRRLGISEIQDLFVIPAFRRQGIGEKLVSACEQYAVSDGATELGIGVGVAGNFGAAQRLYMRMGYIPDGAGVVFDREPMTEGAMKPVDDRMCLMLLKTLSLEKVVDDA